MIPNLPLPQRERAERANQCDSVAPPRGGRRRRPSLRRFLAVLIVGILGGGIAAVAVRKLAPESAMPRRVFCYPSPCTTAPPVIETNIVPAAGQSLVTGTVRSLTSD